MPASNAGTNVAAMNRALVTGASRGLGLALTRHLSAAGWEVVVDARSSADLSRAVSDLSGVRAVPGDLTDDAHRRRLAESVGPALDLLVLNASTLGPSPLPALAELDLAALRQILETNTVAQLGLIQQALPALRAARGTVVAISSDAAAQRYEGWGGYGASKAALDQIANVLTAEEPELTVYVADPGDMRTQMHAEAFPGEDISDRPLPETVLPAFESLWSGRLPSGRYTAAALSALRPIGGIE